MLSSLPLPYRNLQDDPPWFTQRATTYPGVQVLLTVWTRPASRVNMPLVHMPYCLRGWGWGGAFSPSYLRWLLVFFRLTFLLLGIMPSLLLTRHRIWPVSVSSLHREYLRAPFNLHQFQTLAQMTPQSIVSYVLQ